MPDNLWNWIVGAMAAMIGGAWAQVHRRISYTNRRMDRLEDEFRNDIREGFREASEGRSRIWEGLTSYRREMKEDLKSMEDRIVRVINGGRE